VTGDDGLHIAMIRRCQLQLLANGAINQGILAHLVLMADQDGHRGGDARKEM